MFGDVPAVGGQTSRRAEFQCQRGTQRVQTHVVRCIDAGGGLSTGGGYTLNGALGQADAGNLSSAGYALTGGFLSGKPLSLDYHIHLPLVIH